MIRRAALWLAASSLLLLVGFSLVVFAMYGLIAGLGSLEPEKARQLQLLLTFYFRIVCFQGLLPALFVALACWPGVVRLLPRVLETRSRLLGGLVLAATLAYALVAPLLLTAEIGGVPGLQIRNAVDHVGSFVGIVGGVALAAWLPRAFLRRLR